MIETALDMPELWAGLTPRDRAMQVFSHLRVWNTELRNGVLIYVLAADRDVEIVADRGAAAQDSARPSGKPSAGSWKSTSAPAASQEGAVAGVEAVGGLLERQFPARPRRSRRTSESADAACSRIADSLNHL